MRAALNRVHCPACGLRCVVSITSDYAECPEHGRISGLLMMQLKGLSGWEAQVEIRFAELQSFVRWQFYELDRWIINDSFLKIRLPYIV